MQTTSDDNKIRSPRFNLPAFAAALIALALVIFRSVLMPGQLLFTTDDGIGALALRKNALPFGWLGWWDDTTMIGLGTILNINWTNLLLAILPVEFFLNWIHAIDLLAASIFFALYLRNRKVGWPAITLGAIAAFWIGSNFTLTHAGHIGKFGVLIFAAAYLWLSDLAVKRKSWALGLLAGGCIGFMFLEQADVALFCAMLLVPASAFQLWKERGSRLGASVAVLLAMGVAAGLIAFHAIWSGYQGSVKGVAALNQEDPKAQWEFATQWSWPPEESIDFIAPGYTGWASGDASGPYWGRMGRSAGWDQTHQGFRNFKLENHYLSVMAVALAVWVAVLAFGRRLLDGERRMFVIIWSVVTGLALLLSFGKYFPLYRMLFALPGISSIRNPNKFLHLFQIGLGVLAALGLDEFLKSADGAKRLRAVLWGLAALLFLWGLGTISGMNSSVPALSSQGWGPAAQRIVLLKGVALIHGGVAAALLAVFVMLTPRMKGKPAWAWLPVALLAVDSIFLASHYISSQSRDMVKESDLIRFLKSDGVGGRVALATQESFYNYWLTYLFPYYGIQTFNFTQMPRMPVDYENFLQAVGRNPIRLWQATAVNYILGPAQVWNQIQADAQFRSHFALRYAYNVTQRPDGVIEPVTATASQPGQHCVIEYTNATPRYSLIGRWRGATDEEMLNRLKDTAADLNAETLLLRDANVPDSPADAPANAGSVTIREYRPGRVVLGISVTSPAVLRSVERFAPEWKALVDGKPEPVFRCDYILQGLRVEPGLHEVELRYAPALWSLGVQGAGVAICLLSALFLAIKRAQNV